jgi:hypothetical protein
LTGRQFFTARYTHGALREETELVESLHLCKVSLNLRSLVGILPCRFPYDRRDRCLSHSVATIS